MQWFDVTGSVVDRMTPTTRGWLVTSAAFLSNVALGVAFVWSAAPRGASRLALAPSWSLAATAFAVALVMPLAGAFQDRFGARSSATLGAFVVGFGLLTGIEVPARQSLSSLPSVATILFSLITGAGIALTYAATVPSAVKWFAPQHRGRTSGLVVGGFALGTLFAPLALGAVGAFLASTTVHIVFSIVLFALIVSAAQFLSLPPQGLVPPYAFEATPLANGPIMPPPRHTWREALATQTFALMWLTLAIGAGVTIGALWIGFREGPGAGVLGVFQGHLAAAALGSVIGSVLGGTISDHIGRRITVAAGLGLLALATATLALAGPRFALPAALAIGMTYGGLNAVFPALTYDFFGTQHAGADYGAIYTAWAAGGCVGLLLFDYAARSVSSTAVSTPVGPAAFGAAALASILGAVLALRIRPPRRADAHSAHSSVGGLRG